MHPLVAIGLVGGLVYFARSRERKRALRAAESAALPPSMGSSPHGFIITADCKHFLVTDNDLFSRTIKKHYRDQKLAHLAPGDQPDQVPRAMAVNFFQEFAIYCPEGSFSPTNQHPSLSERLMQLYVYLALVGEAVQDGLVSADDAAVISKNRMDEVFAQATPADWTEVFKGTVAVPTELGGNGA